MKMIDTPDVSKEKNINLNLLVPVKYIAVKSASNIFGFLNQSIRGGNGKPKYNRYTVKTKLDGTSRIGKKPK